MISFPRNKNITKGLCKLNYIDFFHKDSKTSWTSGNMLTQAGLHSLNSGPSEENERHGFGPEDKEAFM